MAFDADTIGAAAIVKIPASSIFTDTFSASGDNDVDIVGVELRADRLYRFDVDGANDTRLRIFDALGNELRANDDGADAGEAASTVQPYAEFIPAYTGTYYLGLGATWLDRYDPVTGADRLVPANAGINTTAQTLRVIEESPNAFGPPSRAAGAASISAVATNGPDDERDLTTDADRRLRVEFTPEEQIGTPNDVDLGLHSFVKGDYVVIDVNGEIDPANPLDSFLRVFLGNGSLVASDDDSGSGDDSELVVYVRSTGTHAIAVSGVGNSSYNGSTGAGTTNGDTGAFGLIVHLNPTIIGQSGTADTLNGTSGDDYIVALSGADALSGFAGKDVLAGGDDDDVLNGGSGNDQLYGEMGDDTLNGQTGNDVIVGGYGDDQIDGGSGRDIIDGGAGNDTIDAGIGNDVARGGAGDDVIIGNSNNDVLYGDGGTDTISGGAGNDTAYGGDGDDTINGDNDDDTLHGDAGDDTLSGDAGNDVIYGDIGNDTLRGVQGDDVIVGGAGDDELAGGSENDILTGGLGRDDLSGGNGDDVLLGDDPGIGWVQWPVAAGGNGHFYAAILDPAGITWTDAEAAATELGAHLATITSAAENSFVFALVDDPIYFTDYATGFGGWLGAFQPPGSAEPGGGFQWVTGEAFGFTAWRPGEPNNAGAGEDAISYAWPATNPGSWNDGPRATLPLPSYLVEVDDPTAFNDTLSGGSGTDILTGGVGNDTLNGGGDADTFVFTSTAPGQGVDTIADLLVGTDRIDLQAIFDATGSVVGSGNFNDFVLISNFAGGSRVLVDADGVAGGAFGFTLIAEVSGVDAAALDDPDNFIL